MDFLKSQLNAWNFQQALSTLINMGSDVSQNYSWGMLPFYKYSLVFSQRFKVSCSVTSTSSWPHVLYPTGFLCPGNSPGKNTGVGCHFLLQGTFPTQGLNPGIPHCRRILYQLSHKGSPAGKSQLIDFCHPRMTFFPPLCNFIVLMFILSDMNIATLVFLLLVFVWDSSLPISI